MTITLRKDVFVSYAERDRDAALSLESVLKDWLGEAVWVRDLDLNAGDMVYEAIDSAMSKAKWLIILITKAALESRWIKREAQLGTFRSLENEDFQTIVVKLEECEYPSSLRLLLKSQMELDLADESSLEDGFIRIAELISETEITTTNSSVYEGRGADSDNVSLIARNNQIIFVVGWQGIGKTTFVEHSLEDNFGKKALVVPLTIGHSMDRLARDIIKVTHVRQPVDDHVFTDDELLQRALDALGERQRRQFLFLDDIELGLDGSNSLLPYLRTFLESFVSRRIQTYVVLATSRNPDFPLEIAHTAEVYRLGTLRDEFIEAIVYQWLGESEQTDQLRRRVDEREALIKAIGGHPLAAKRMASFLKIKSVNQLLDANRLERFQRNFAEHILRAIQAALGSVHRLILQILAAIAEPILQSDLLVINRLTSQFTQQEISQAVWELTDWYLIEQKGEFLFLHRFLQTYYIATLKQETALRAQIAEDFGLFAYGRAKKLEEELESMQNTSEAPELIKLSNEVFRYSLPADHLLRSIGKDDLASRLPIRTQGTLRRMVYYFYQEAQDFSKALEYIDKWLAVNPNDSEVRLYQIRCYRKLGGRDNVVKARHLIQRLERERPSKQDEMRLIRERALLARIEGDNETAKAFFRQAIKLDEHSRQPYSEIYVGLARILIQEADDQPEWSEEHDELAKEALQLLEIAKRETDNFYRYHLASYAEALIQAGLSGQAQPLLSEALYYQPDDGKLNFRMAEVLRREKDYPNAKSYAEKAIRYGHTPSLLTLANILYDEAQSLPGRASSVLATSLLDDALRKVEAYKRSGGDAISRSNVEVADTIRAKIYRAKGQSDKVFEILTPYSPSSNPYTVYELAMYFIQKANSESARHQVANELGFVARAVSTIETYKYRKPNALEELYQGARAREMSLREKLGVQ